MGLSAKALGNVGALGTWLALGLGARGSCGSCDSKAESEAPVEASVLDAAPSAVAEVQAPCTHAGNLDAVERDPACVVQCADAGDPRRLKVSLEASSTTSLPGGIVGLTARITSTDREPVIVCLQQDGAERTGWERLAGVNPPPPKENPCSGYKLPFTVRTFDTRHVDVDQLRLGVTPGCRRTVRITLMPGRSLFRMVQWTAIRLPAPPPPFEDDAGRRYFPKAVAHPLPKGVYTIEAEMPFVDAPQDLRIASTSVEVRPGNEDAR